MRNVEKILRLVRSLPIDTNDVAILNQFKELLNTTQSDITTKLYREILYNPLGNQDIVLNQIPEPFTQYVRAFRSILARNAKLNNPYQFLNPTKPKELDAQVQRDLITKAERQILALKEALKSANKSLQSQVASAIRDGINPSEYQARLREVNQTLDYVENVYKRFSEKVIPTAYANGAEITRNILESNYIIDNKFLFDNKTINTLIKHATDDLSRGIKGARDLIGFTYKVSKQAFLTEQEISQLVASEYMATGDAKKVQKKIFDTFASLQGRHKNESSKIVTGLNRDVTNLEADAQFQSIIDAKLNALRKEYSNLPQAQFDKLMAKALTAANEEKYIRIINKNGEYMHFTLEHYSELVTRTRIGDSQVSGTMEMALKDGIDLFRITKHNTTSHQCIGHEGQFYTTNLKLIGKYFKGHIIREATRENLPLYHPGNCLHRVVAVAYLDAEITDVGDSDSTSTETTVNQNVTPSGQLSNPATAPKPEETNPSSQNSSIQDAINNRNKSIARENRKSANLANARKQFELTGLDIEKANADIASGKNTPINFKDLTRSNKSLYDQLGKIIQSKIEDARILLEKQMLPDEANEALKPISDTIISEKYIRIKNKKGQYVFLTIKEARAAGLKF